MEGCLRRKRDVSDEPSVGLLPADAAGLAMGIGCFLGLSMDSLDQHVRCAYQGERQS